MVTKRKKNRKQRMKQHLKFEAYGILLFVLFIIELSKMGYIGDYLNLFFRFLVGQWDFTLSLIGLYLSLYLMTKRKFSFHWSMRKIGLLLIYISLIILNHVVFVENIQLNGMYKDIGVLKATWQQFVLEMKDHGNVDLGGGMVGALFYQLFNYLFDHSGTKVILVALILVGILLFFHFSYVELFKKIKLFFQNQITVLEEKVKDFLLLLNQKQPKAKRRKLPQKNNEEHIENEPNSNHFDHYEEPIIHDFMDRNVSTNQSTINHNTHPLNMDLELENQEGDDNQEIELSGISLQNEEKNYFMPPFHILNSPEFQEQGEEFKDISNNAKKLESTLESFGVKARVTQIHRGPAVTRFEIQPDVGVKVSRIVNLADDIALSLAAKDIRIEAPIPGKAAIGIEVPNSEIAVVTLKEVLESQAFYESKSKLSLGLGRDISGEPIIGNLSKMPHLLVAGATGSGKSVCINSMIVSILYKAKPSEVKFLMIDPKMVELNVYNGIPHLLSPVVTDPKKASKALKMIVNEMEKRYESFAEKGARDIERYNALLIDESPEKAQILPYIVVIIDELADLMMVAPNDVEDAIIRLAQKARAAGIHLIVATQRPSVDVITGLIKANIPSRIAFGVSSQTDSRTIIDMGGAEKLLGRGDMLYFPVGYSKPVRVQGAFITDLEVEAVVQYVKEQQQANYQEGIVTELNKPNEAEEVDEVLDDLFYEAVELVVETKQASVSMLQRRLRVGYTRAARLIDEMEKRGIIGPYEGSKPRTVLISIDQYQQMKIPI
ncbi:DNA translocase FtsK 4TM domain-containing protein [Tepidibacillus infernus]|uniref:FtsK/SpoIIIE family DNA translocase n=1 Tax=Tepidibacillus TaxID=1494427 RepID=UPI00085383F1|nr:DNA translocase FtsK [Tepidibacillus sp. HK-1]GBF11302.1 DNA translocase SpoIIIE [Tepidibacillus sp. HK-1]